uniref:Ig-like domain-containing protein n=1 Tax=Dicentrarchus labrax TaxID=13489 RepID=A0A8P4KCC6_DICLA
MKTKQRDHSLLSTCCSSQLLNTADMTQPLFISVLLAALCLECRAQRDNVLQPKGDVTATEGEEVTLDCQYNSSSSNDYLFWYKQDGNNSPKFILSRFKVGTGKTEDTFKEEFSSTLDSTMGQCCRCRSDVCTVVIAGTVCYVGKMKTFSFKKYR